MKKPITQSFSRLLSTLSSAILFGGLALLLSDCFLKQDRTTTIYGTVTDQNGQPVDSILLVINGVDGFKYERLTKLYSNNAGKYEMVTDVPKKYSSVNLVIPFSNSQNPKYSKFYLGKNIFIDGVKTNECCSASIGQKTRYDFQLIPR